MHVRCRPIVDFMVEVQAYRISGIVAQKISLRNTFDPSLSTIGLSDLLIGVVHVVHAIMAITSDEKIALLGAIQSLFKDLMYSFVFLWTPALGPSEEEIPNSVIFETLMLASRLGSSLTSRLMAKSSLKIESYMHIVFTVYAASLRLPIVTSFLVAPSQAKGGRISFAGCVQPLGFSAFEACVGIFWPSLMKIRSHYIPEEARSTIMNFFHIPLNIFLCIILYNVDAFSITIIFGIDQAPYQRKCRDWIRARKPFEELLKKGFVCDSDNATYSTLQEGQRHIDGILSLQKTRERVVVLEAVKLELDGLVVIRGDNSNTNAYLLTWKLMGVVAIFAIEINWNCMEEAYLDFGLEFDVDEVVIPLEKNHWFEFSLELKPLDNEGTYTQFAKLQRNYLCWHGGNWARLFQ